MMVGHFKEGAVMSIWEQQSRGRELEGPTFPYPLPNIPCVIAAQLQTLLEFKEIKLTFQRIQKGFQFIFSMEKEHLDIFENWTFF